MIQKLLLNTQIIMISIKFEEYKIASDNPSIFQKESFRKNIKTNHDN